LAHVKIAKTFGLSIPLSLLTCADEVVESRMSPIVARHCRAAPRRMSDDEG